MRVAVLLAATGCLAYGPGSYNDLGAPFPGKRVALGGCLDLSVSMIEDDVAHGRVVHYTFGNGCWHPVVVDLGSVRAYTRDGHGIVRRLAAYDPKHELAPLRIESLWRGNESIEYRDNRDDPPESICVDVGGIDAEAPRIERWVCMSQGEVR
jgi:hypothetical protein